VSLDGEALEFGNRVLRKGKAGFPNTREVKGHTKGAYSRGFSSISVQDCRCIGSDEGAGNYHPRRIIVPGFSPTEGANPGHPSGLENSDGEKAGHAELAEPTHP
jgi:hypothetical protein